MLLFLQSVGNILLNIEKECVDAGPQERITMVLFELCTMLVFYKNSYMGRYCSMRNGISI